LRVDFALNEDQLAIREAIGRICERFGDDYWLKKDRERYLREVMISRIAPISPQLILCYVAEKVLGLPKSY
jgi:hypothetical protein